MMKSMPSTPRPSTQETIAHLKEVPLFSGCSTELLSRLGSVARLSKVPKGKVLYQKEEQASWLYIIRHGWVKLYQETLSGEEAVIDILTDGHMFGEGALFHNGTYTHHAQVVEDAELLLLPFALLKEQIQKESSLALAMLAALSAQHRRQEREIEHLAVQTAPQRIGCFLLKLCTGNEKDIVLHLPYDKTLLAARLGMKPETFSRALNTLRKETGISVSGASITIGDIQRLSDFSCSACSSTFPCEE
jgi:CRP/FNR family transcriptional regulator, dissimilatory nitrate respiration regulator